MRELHRLAESVLIENVLRGWRASCARFAQSATATSAELALAGTPDSLRALIGTTGTISNGKLPALHAATIHPLRHPQGHETAG